jgi:hypothetical protein
MKFIKCVLGVLSLISPICQAETIMSWQFKAYDGSTQAAILERTDEDKTILTISGFKGSVEVQGTSGNEDQLESVKGSKVISKDFGQSELSSLLISSDPETIKGARNQMADGFKANETQLNPNQLCPSDITEMMILKITPKDKTAKFVPICLQRVYADEDSGSLFFEKNKN